MKYYRFPEQRFSHLRRQAVIYTALIVSFSLGATIGTALLLRRNPIVQFFIHIPPIVWAFTIALSLSAGSICLYVGLRITLEGWISAVIEIDDNYISRRQARINEICIMRSEVESVMEYDKGLAIFSIEKSRSLLIPKLLLDPADYDEIKRALASWTTIQPMPPRRRFKTISLAVLIGALAIAGSGIILFSVSAQAVLLAGLAITAYQGYLLWKLRQTKGVDPRYLLTVAFGVVVVSLLVIIKAIALYGAYDFLVLKFMSLGT